MAKEISESRSSPTIGRPCIYVAPGGEKIELSAHIAFMACRAKRQLLACHRRGRKTSMCLEKMFQYLISNPGIVGKTLAPIRKQAKENIWKDPDMLFHPNVCPPEIIKNKNETDLSIELINGSIWTLDGADDPQTKRGGNVKVLHLTEIGDHQEAIWSQIYEPILEANGGILLGEGNPRGKNWYNRLFEKAKSRPGWATFLISARDTPIFTPAQLRDLESNMPYNVFASEYLCEWVDSVGTVFRNVQECSISSPKEAQPMREYRFSLDLGKATDFTVLGGIDRHTWEQIFFDRFNMVDWTIIKARVIEGITKYAKRENKNKVELVIECNGIGDPFFDTLVHWYNERDAEGVAPSKLYDITFVPFTTTQASKTALVSNMSMLLDQKIIALLPEPSQLYEFGVFTYEKTKTGFIYGAPTGEHDDCFVAGTKILTDHGQIPIEQIQIGDLVMTRNGYRPVVNTRSKIKEVVTNIGLTGTPNHPVITTMGEVGLSHVCDSDMLYVWNEKLSSIEERNIIAIQNQKDASLASTSGDTTNGKSHRSRFIGRFGLIISEISRKVSSFIIKMKTLQITISKILSYCLKANTQATTCSLPSVERSLGRMESSKLTDSKKLFENGASDQKQVKSIGLMPLRILCTNLKKLVALGAQKSLLLGQRMVENGVLMSAPKEIIKKERKQRVYNLQVFGKPEYFANNILVHNCVMSALIGYWSLGAKLQIPVDENAKPKTRFGIPIKQKSSGINPWLI